jgi:signal transduction histidine kinase/ActR/RegA family two-component response regulator
MSASAVDQDDIAAVQQGVLEHLAIQARRVPAPVLTVALTTVLMALDKAPTWAPLAWFALVLTVVGFRRIVLTKLPADAESPLSARMRTAFWLSAVNGVSQGLAAAFWPYLDTGERIVQTLILTGVCTGAVATTMGQRTIYLAFLVPAILPLITVWSLDALSASGGDRSLVVALFIGMFALVLAGLARDIHALFSRAHLMRRQQEALNVKLREALEEAQAASRAKTRFLASASHDLRQPIHTMSLFVEALNLRVQDDRTKPLVKDLREAMLALSTQLDSLLDISKLDAGVVQPCYVHVDLQHLMQRLCHSYRPEAARRGLSLQLIGSEPAAALTDPVLLERILRNLIDNALKYTAKGGVELHVGSYGSTLYIRVVDTGCGIAPENQRAVFEEFFQVGNPGRDRAHGLGLGLSIVKRLADLLASPLSLSSTLGQGTMVELQLPPCTTPPTESPDVDSDFSAAGLSVLVIDDELSVRQGMRQLLEEIECRPMLAASTAEALDLAAACTPDVVLADFRLGAGSDGIDAIDQLRSSYPGLPAILITGDTAPDRLREAQRAGIATLHKPVTLNRLLDSIERELSGPGGRSHENTKGD